MGVTGPKRRVRSIALDWLWFAFGLGWIAFGLDWVAFGLDWVGMGWLWIGLDWVLVARLLGFGSSVLFALARFCLCFASAVAMLEICSARFVLARFDLFGLLGSSVSVCAVAPHVCCRYFRD